MRFAKTGIEAEPLDIFIPLLAAARTAWLKPGAGGHRCRIAHLTQIPLENAAPAP
jgi:hypothetical protein